MTTISRGLTIRCGASVTGSARRQTKFRLRASPCYGTYFLFVDVDGFDVDFFKHIKTEARVTEVPVIAFYQPAAVSFIQFWLAKQVQVLHDAAVRLAAHFG
jgi:aspartate/methionine/tyrosine aminotransferase